MECPVCHTATHAPAAYCIDCGALLDAAGERGGAPALPPLSLCTACRHTNAPVSTFCTRCGAPLDGAERPVSLEPGAPLDDERRTVTVLHADLCGFTRIAERLNPEQTRSLMGSLFNAITREIVAAGGVIDAYIGDAVLAVFGVPQAHGDDPRRAARAALAMHRAVDQFAHPILATLPVRLQLRIGIDTGPVIVGRIGALRRTTITGATVASAMDLERAAPVGGTLLGEATRRLLPDAFTLAAFPLSSGRAAWHLQGILEPAADPADADEDEDEDSAEDTISMRPPDGSGDVDFDEEPAWIDAAGAPELPPSPGTAATHPRRAGSPGEAEAGLEALAGRSSVASALRGSPAFGGAPPFAPTGLDHASPPSVTAIPMEVLLQGTGARGTEDSRALVQARIDRLPPQERRLIKAAAVAGMSFWQELLERMGIVETARGLAALEQLELIRAVPRSSIPGTNEYTFTAGLVREVAYENNLFKVRRFYHRVVAAWLEERSEGSLEHVSLLAWHHATGGDPLAAAGILVSAAERVAADAPIESITLYREALAHLGASEAEGPEAVRLIERCRSVVDALAVPGEEEG